MGMRHVAALAQSKAKKRLISPSEGHSLALPGIGMCLGNRYPAALETTLYP